MGTFLHVKAGSGHLSHGGQGWHGFCLGQARASGHLGHTGGTICDFNIYKSSSPLSISFFLTHIERSFIPSLNKLKLSFALKNIDETSIVVKNTKNIYDFFNFMYIQYREKDF